MERQRVSRPRFPGLSSSIDSCLSPSPRFPGLSSSIDSCLSPSPRFPGLSSPIDSCLSPSPRFPGLSSSIDSCLSPSPRFPGLSSPINSCLSPSPRFRGLFSPIDSSPSPSPSPPPPPSPRFRFRRRFLTIDSSPSPSPSPPPPPSPTFETPWRKLEWGNTYYDLQYVKDFEPERDVLTQLRVLLYGPIGAGKSSFINSVSTILRGRMVNTALASATNYEEASFTKKYETYKIKKESWGSYYPFVFNDIMGVEEGSGRGVRVEDIKLAMMGHVKENYKFNPVSPLSPSDSGYNAAPSLDDRVHVLVCVCSGNAADISESALKKMREIREAASELGIPQLLLVTKLDEACPETEKDLQNIYKSKFVKKKMTQLSSELGIPLNCILPVKNYSYETSQDEDVDTLILNALRLILDFGNDFIEKL